MKICWIPCIFHWIGQIFTKERESGTTFDKRVQILASFFTRVNSWCHFSICTQIMLFHKQSLSTHWEHLLRITDILQKVILSQLVITNICTTLSILGFFPSKDRIGTNISVTFLALHCVSITFLHQGSVMFIIVLRFSFT